MTSLAISSSLAQVQRRVLLACQKLSPPAKTLLLAVSKTKPIEDVFAAYNAGQRHFGENYVQELQAKWIELPPDIKWHFIGHLQKNKCRILASIANLHLVETIDSEKIAKALNAACSHCGRLEKIGVLMQVNTSAEESKSGVSTEDCVKLASYIVNECQNLSLEGLMCIGRARSREPGSDFRTLAECRNAVAEALQIPASKLQLSMGMSNDFELAVISFALEDVNHIPFNDDKHHFFQRNKPIYLYNGDSRPHQFYKCHGLYLVFSPILVLNSTNPIHTTYLPRYFGPVSSYFALAIPTKQLHRSKTVQPKFAWARRYSVLETRLDMFNAKNFCERHQQIAAVWFFPRDTARTGN